jgi:hypothetical protein
MTKRVIPGVTKAPPPKPATKPGVKGPPRHVKGTPDESLWWIGKVVGTGFAVVFGCVKLALLLALFAFVLKYL